MAGKSLDNSCGIVYSVRVGSEGSEQRRKILGTKKGSQKMGFQVVENDNKRGPRTVTDPIVSFNGTNAHFRLNHLAVEMLGDPEKVEVMYDEDTNRIALVPSDSPIAVTLRREDAETPNRYFSFRSLSKKLGMDHRRGKSILTLDEATGYYVLSVEELGSSEIIKRGPRKPKDADTEAE